MRAAYATLVTNADYARGAVALAKSLKATGTDVPLRVLAPRAFPELEAVADAGAEIVETAPLPVSAGFRARHGRDAQHRAAPFTKGEKPAFHDPLDNFQKLRVWEQADVDRVVFLDADAIAVRNVDKLFGYPQFSGAPNLYETLDDFHRLNSGVFVATPNQHHFERMLRRLDAPDTFWRRTDQTFLEAWFPDWHGLPYTYNTLQYVFFNLPALWNWPQIRVVHYQYEKPWQREHAKSDRLKPLIDLWWTLYDGGLPPEQLPTAA